jgi:hypothetical protein
MWLQGRLDLAPRCFICFLGFYLGEPQIFQKSLEKQLFIECLEMRIFEMRYSNLYGFQPNREIKNGGTGDEFQNPSTRYLYIPERARLFLRVHSSRIEKQIYKL